MDVGICCEVKVGVPTIDGDICAPAHYAVDRVRPIETDVVRTLAEADRVIADTRLNFVITVRCVDLAIALPVTIVQLPVVPVALKALSPVVATKRAVIIARREINTRQIT